MFLPEAAKIIHTMATLKDYIILLKSIENHFSESYIGEINNLYRNEEDQIMRIRVEKYTITLVLSVKFLLEQAAQLEPIFISEDFEKLHQLFSKFSSFNEDTSRVEFYEGLEDLASDIYLLASELPKLLVNRDS